MTPLHTTPPTHIHQSCNAVVFAERMRMCPWPGMKEKSTGIKFQCNCLLNCGLQLLKFYPWFCVTTAVMNSVWLWFSHWRHASLELEKKGSGGGVFWLGCGMRRGFWSGLRAVVWSRVLLPETNWWSGHTAHFRKEKVCYQHKYVYLKMYTLNTH